MSWTAVSLTHLPSGYRAHICALSRGEPSAQHSPQSRTLPQEAAPYK